MTPEEINRIIKDLEDKQIALELQNAELRKAQAALKENELKLHCIIQGSPIPTFVISKDHRVIHWNRALEEISGIRADEVMGTNQHWRAFYDQERPCLADLLIFEDLEEIPRWYLGKYTKSRFIAGAYEAIDFFPALGEGGRWLYFTAALIRDSVGSIVGAIETLEDVTGHKQAEILLRESEQRYREIFNATSEAIIIFDARSGQIIDVNASMLSMFGYLDKRDVMQRNIADLSAVAPHNSRTETRKRLQAAAEGDPQYFTWQARKKKGETFQTDVTLRHSKIGGQERVIAVVRDIKGRK